MEIKKITIRFPLDLWKEIRGLQTEGKLRSIQEVAIDGSRLIVDMAKKHAVKGTFSTEK